MFRSKIKNIEDVAAWQLCCGCGACAYISPDEIEMIDCLDVGRRPQLKNTPPQDLRSQEALSACPGIKLNRNSLINASGANANLLPAWGSILEVWEGYAADEQIRYHGASGGAAMALGLYAVEKGQMDGVLHIKARPDVPYLNHTVLSTTREQLLAGAGSRYAPASPCDGLNLIEKAQRPCVFIGKPCDVAAVHKSCNLRPKLKEKVGLTIAFFCAGTPATNGTLEIFKSMGIESPEDVKSIRYRGQGWPGNATVTFSKNGKLLTKKLTYEQAWGDILQKYRQWRCYICADHTGEFADIAVADAWHRAVEKFQPGLSVILARTERGKKILHQAQNDGYLHLIPSDPEILPLCRPGQLQMLGAIWGRATTLKLFGIPTPKYRGYHFLNYWLRNLNLMQKIKSTGGTIRRIFRKKLHKKSNPIFNQQQYQ